ncbi:MAG: hypothetical protein V7K32_12310 [Nostoc sp.]|uniref:hypothetical protein n=1 Tax=Nostoc sp. TaxID=1180 RepID=UPI002FF9EEF1
MRQIVNWLKNLVNILNFRSTTVKTQTETTRITPEDIETYEQFIQKILQVTDDSNGDAQVIYPLLAANTDKLNHIFADLWRDWATNTLAEAEADKVESIAYLIIIPHSALQNVLSIFSIKIPNNVQIIKY